ncbi:DEAD/DEAH box helicase [Stutzerimonas balearica]|uniref:DEAD/DEAH box helicase n=1 Tax=Stutzerimonas balearica TaxID=74829 RepID=UPI0022AF93DB|nr:DEAD/DEAH box helicase [Stutzerimonas balearica]MCZ4130286.1 DEAD/DEAH box helicase [Stutzerimonas balearica]
MKVRKIQGSVTPYDDLVAVLDELHRVGPINSSILETLSLYRIFHPDTFSQLEERIISALGLFYKVLRPENLYSFLLSSIGEAHKSTYGEYLTPVQASVRRAVDNKQFISISAPTSAGKSYSIRDFIAEQNGDAVVIVPSRALIAEYINTMKERFNGDKGVMITSFVDAIFTNRDPRRIFVLTPERARDLFTTSAKLDIKVFFFDEAHVSEDRSRGVLFDVLVRRIQKAFPSAKLIFAHPFVDNPDAQFKKHDIPADNAYARSYTHGTVGKICVFQHSNSHCYIFSPFEEKGNLIRHCVKFAGGFESLAFNGKHSILIYVSKTSIYNGSFLEGYQEHIDKFPSIKDPKATKIISAVENLLGANKVDHRSKMVDLLHKGVVIHHGSVPLEVRFLVEDFIRAGFAKICFATSTLAQGVNMPFDIVWLDNMRFQGESDEERSLSFKNLIGRAGRLSRQPKFDYGYVFTRSPELFTSRINDKFVLDETSIVDQPYDEKSDNAELLDSIKDGTLDDELHLPQTKIGRLSTPEVSAAAEAILDILYAPNRTIKEALKGDINRGNKIRLNDCFLVIFEKSLDRMLGKGEMNVFENAISIMLQTFQGRSFKEIVGIRYSYISRRSMGRRGGAEFSQPAHKLPNNGLNAFSLYKDGTPANEVSYDIVVFDTYDYLDQVISFSLSDVFIAAFKVYKTLTADARADRMIELLRFGTNDSMHMLLMRYGFAPEDIEEITSYVQSISESDIVFKSSIYEAPFHIKNMVDWYLP